MTSAMPQSLQLVASSSSPASVPAGRRRNESATTVVLDEVGPPTTIEDLELIDVPWARAVAPTREVVTFIYDLGDDGAMKFVGTGEGLQSFLESEGTAIIKLHLEEATKRHAITEAEATKRHAETQSTKRHEETQSTNRALSIRP